MQNDLLASQIVLVPYLAHKPYNHHIDVNIWTLHLRYALIQDHGDLIQHSELKFQDFLLDYRIHFIALRLPILQQQTL